MNVIRNSLYGRLPRCAAALLLTFGLAASAFAQTRVDPGFNLFSTQQEIEVGKKSAQEVEREIPLVRDRDVTRFIEQLGGRLAAEAPGAKYPYRFRVLDVADLNAFALPGGYVYVNRGLVESVQNEQQLAGVMAHEIAHVALRHATNQISKAYLAQAGLSVLGGLVGEKGAADDILRVVGGAGVPLLFLKFSRNAESQADIVGVQMMARAGYNPRALANVFDTLQSKSRGGPPEFLSSHPNYASRRENIEREAGLVKVADRPVLGGFPRAQARLADMRKAPSMDELLGEEGRPSTTRPPDRDTRRASRADLERPSSRFTQFRQRNDYYRIDYPDNWIVREARDGFGVTIAPANGIERRNDRQEIIGGVIVNHYTPFLEDRDGSGAFSFRDQEDYERSPSSLREATRDLLVQILDNNPHLQPVSNSMRRRDVDGQYAIATELSGTSAFTGELERVTVITRDAGDGHVLYLLLVRPDDERYLTDTFERMVSSLRVNDQAVHTDTE